MGAGVSTFQVERELIAGKLIAAGVDCVSLDRGQAPPFVLVGMPTGTGRGGSPGAWPCEFPITVVQLPPGDSVNAAWMLDQVELILTTLGLAPFRPTVWGNEQIPAYQLTYPRSVPNPTC